MHPLSANEIPALPDWWAPNVDGLERLAVALLGPTSGGWVRRTSRPAVIADRYLGVDAAGIGAALAALADSAARIRADKRPAAALRAAAFYHLRFENIHPLRDGNGRVGRAILAMQCEQASRFPAREILGALHAHENEYKWVFRPEEQAQRYELLLDLLARLTATALDADAAVLRVPLEPERPLPNRPAAPSAKPPLGPQKNFWRKFG